MSVASEESFLHDQKPFETKEKTNVEMGGKLRETDMDADGDDDDLADSFQDLMKRIQAAKIQPISEEEFERRSEAVRTMTEDSSKILRYGLGKEFKFFEWTNILSEKDVYFHEKVQRSENPIQSNRNKVEKFIFGTWRGIGFSGRNHENSGLDRRVPEDIYTDKNSRQSGSASKRLRQSQPDRKNTERDRLLLYQRR